MMSSNTQNTYSADHSTQSMSNCLMVWRKLNSRKQL